MGESEKVNVYKVEVMVIDHDGIGPGEVQAVIENTRYPNRCIAPEVMSIETREVDWHEQHPLNLRGRTKDAYRELFALDGYSIALRAITKAARHSLPGFTKGSRMYAEVEAHIPRLIEEGYLREGDDDAIWFFEREHILKRTS